jgi:hypothetical protein
MLDAADMKSIRLFVALAVSSGLSLGLTASTVHASCLAPCGVQLCAGTRFGSDDTPSIVTATHDAAAPGVLIVETVLRSGPGPALHPGDQLTAAEPIPGPHLLIYASTPPALFPIGDDGFVRCAYFPDDQLAPQGHGATPQAIASLAGTADCVTALSRAGYPISSCNDMPSGSGCQIAPAHGGTTAGLAVPLVLALVGALAALAGWRSRRRRAGKDIRGS